MPKNSNLKKKLGFPPKKSFSSSANFCPLNHCTNRYTWVSTQPLITTCKLTPSAFFTFLQRTTLKLGDAQGRDVFTPPRFLFFVFLGPHLWHMEASRLGVKSELQLPAYTTATATQDPNHVCDLHHSSRQRQILNPLSKTRDQTLITMDASQFS